MTSFTTPRPTSTVFAPPAAAPNKQELIAEAIGAIINGRPFPEHLRPPSYLTQRPATVRDGITGIISGRAGAPCH